MRVDRRRDPHNLGLVGGIHWQDAGDARTSLGDCPCLIDSKRLELSNRFEERTALDQHAASGHCRQARNNRYRRPMSRWLPDLT